MFEVLVDISTSISFQFLVISVIEDNAKLLFALDEGIHIGVRFGPSTRYHSDSASSTRPEPAPDTSPACPATATRHCHGNHHDVSIGGLVLDPVHGDHVEPGQCSLALVHNIAMSVQFPVTVFSEWWSRERPYLRK